MFIARRTECALRALLHLSLAGVGAPAPMKAADIARKEGVSHKYVEQQLLVAKKAGLVRSKSGQNGGYFLSRPAREISVASVVRAFEGDSAVFAREGSAANLSPVSLALNGAWDKARASLAGALEATTLEDLAGNAREEMLASARMYHI